MTAERIVVVGASSGGIEALRALAAQLPADFPAPIAVVLHTAPHSPGILHEILGRSGPLTAGTRLEPGVICVAPHRPAEEERAFPESEPGSEADANASVDTNPKQLGGNHGGVSPVAGSSLRYQMSHLTLF